MNSDETRSEVNDMSNAMWGLHMANINASAPVEGDFIGVVSDEFTIRPEGLAIGPMGDLFVSNAGKNEVLTIYLNRSR